MAKSDSGYGPQIKKIASIADAIKGTEGKIEVSYAAAKGVISSLLTFRPSDRELTKEQKRIRDEQYENADNVLRAYVGVAGDISSLVEKLKVVKSELPKVKGASTAHDVMINLYGVGHAISRLDKAPDKRVAETYRDVQKDLKKLQAELKEKFKKVGFTEEYERTH